MALRNTETHWTRLTSFVLNLSKNMRKNQGSLVTAEKVSCVANGEQCENSAEQFLAAVRVLCVLNTINRHKNADMCTQTYYSIIIIIMIIFAKNRSSTVGSEHRGSVLRVFGRGVIDHGIRRARRSALTATH